MLARLQQLATVVLLFAAAVPIWYGLAARSVVQAALGVLLIVAAYSTLLAAEFALLWYSARREPLFRASPAQLTKAWWGEVLAAPAVCCWQQPFRSKAQPDLLPQAPGSQRGVVLVHGFACNRGLWNPWLQRLRQLDIPFVAVDLEPVLGSIDDYPALIDVAVRRISAATGQAPVLVAHSMGGLAVRAWLDVYAADGHAHRIITVASPHRGTYMARFAFSLNGQQMGQDSPWLQHLAPREPATRFSNFTCFFGHCDNLVFPVTNATLPGADNRHLAECAHVRMACHEAVFEQLLRWVKPR